MKKLMTAAAIVCATVASQAASVTWNATSFEKVTGCTATSTGKKDVKMMVWEFSASDWNTDYQNADKLWAAYNDAKNTAIKADTALINDLSKTTKMASVTGGSTWSEGDTVYAAILFLHDDTNKYVGGEDYYMANWASKLASAAGATVDNLGSKIGGNGLTGTSTPTSWQAIPEPTSGLLMLLGFAGLALRRRRA